MGVMQKLMRRMKMMMTAKERLTTKMKGQISHCLIQERKSMLRMSILMMKTQKKTSRKERGNSLEMKSTRS